MEVLLYILVSAVFVSAVSFVGILTLFLKEEALNKILLVLVAFSAGALIGGAFLHLIPEAIEKVGEGRLLSVFLFVLLGFCVFLVLEQFISWHHCHKTHHSISAFSYLILISDGVHNFIDGMVIAASFVFSIPLGVATTLAVVFHEIPQEIGDFGVLVFGGFKKTRALVFNFLSGLVAVAGALAGFFLSEKIGGFSVYLLPFAAGNFIYIASADLIPEIKKKCEVKESAPHFIVFLLGIIFMLMLKI